MRTREDYLIRIGLKWNTGILRCTFLISACFIGLVAPQLSADTEKPAIRSDNGREQQHDLHVDMTSTHSITLSVHTGKTLLR